MANLANLLSVLNGQIVIYKNFLSLAEQKKEVLVRGDIPSLEEITAKEQSLFAEARRLEDERLELHRELSLTYGIDATELTVAKLLEKVSGPDKEALQGSIDRMEKVIRQIQEVNKFNSSLIQQSLDFIDFSVNLLTRLQDTPTYGEGNNRQPARLVDRKI